MSSDEDDKYKITYEFHWNCERTRSLRSSIQPMLDECKTKGEMVMIALDLMSIGAVMAGRLTLAPEDMAHLMDEFARLHAEGLREGLDAEQDGETPPTQ